ncbi:single-stranded DNA-binding protein [bacterium]|nr:single-stranded DNA-binding protein [bacterium]|tara:strand:- start:9276 stop:9773 length:498 start_codon:yes stop_codon:yes gene_type:complete
MNLNKAFILGRLTRDPESKTMPSGQAVANFSMATNRVWTDDQGQKQERTEFHNIVAFRRLAEICSQYLKKGSLVLIEGKIQTRSWDDQQTGAKKYWTEIVADNMQMGPRSQGAPAQAQSAPAPSKEVPTVQAETPESVPEKEKPEESSMPSSNDNGEVKVEEIPF